MKTDKEGKLEEASSFLVGHEAGVLATISQTGGARARLVYYTCDDAFNVYFITLKNTRKVTDMIFNSSAAFFVSETEIPRTLQMEGTVSNLSVTATDDPLLTDFVHRLMEHKKYGIPLAHFDASELQFYKFTPDWIRWGDFTFGQGTDAVFTELHPIEGDS